MDGGEVQLPKAGPPVRARGEKIYDLEVTLRVEVAGVVAGLVPSCPSRPP